MTLKLEIYELPCLKILRRSSVLHKNNPTYSFLLEVFNLWKHVLQDGAPPLFSCFVTDVLNSIP
jgi:hypothetical protein